MPSDSYKPIACADYDIYEIAIMQHRQLSLKWVTDFSEAKASVVIPLELKIKNSAEYLVYKIRDDSHNSHQRELRLDKIITAILV